MELILNILWFVLAGAAVAALLRSRRDAGFRAERISNRKALLALGCIVVLLFPVISASDDLHPSQAVFEDSSKRIQHTVAMLINTHSLPDCAMLLTLLSMLGLFGLMLAQPLRLVALAPRTLVGQYSSTAGRAPPVRF